MRSRAALIAIWVATLLVAALIVLRAPFLTDMSVFLPTSPTPEQKLLIANLQHGESARTLLISVGPLVPDRQRMVSDRLISQWRNLTSVATVSNGNLNDFAPEREKLFSLRYLLGASVDGSEFEAPALTGHLKRARALLASSAGLFNKQTILRDPTGAGLQSLQRLAGAAGPERHDGVWVNAQRTHLLFLLQTAVDGADLDAQEQLLESIKAAVHEDQALRGAGITVSGAPVFAVASRNQIKGDVITLSTIGIGLIVSLLLLSFRSPAVLVVALIPLATAVLCGSAAVALGFGSAHALTLGFGVALIGECVDYALYHLVHRSAARVGDNSFWAPIRLGVLTSLTGFAALLFSDFPGLAQLAVFAMVGLSAGFLTTRWLMPVLPLPATPARAIELFYRLEQTLHRIALRLTGLRAWSIGLIIICLVIAVGNRDELWSNDIAALNPVSAQAQEVDSVMRQALGGPDVNNVVIVRADQPGQSVLAATDAVSAALRAMADRGEFRSIKTVSDLLPPRALQQQRQQALPTAAQLQARIASVQPETGLPARALKQFIDDVSQARDRPVVTANDYADTRLAGTLDSLLTTVDDRQTAIITLETDPQKPVSATAIQAGLQAALKENPALANAAFDTLNLKARTDELYAGYIRDAVNLSLAGAAAIVLLLLLTLRDWRALIRVIVPIAGAISVIVAGFALSGTAMHLLHLVGLLMVAAIGSNYALVLASATDCASSAEQGDLVLTPLILANLTTVAGFGVLAASSIPLLAALGMTVGIGAPLVLLLAATVRPDRGTGDQ